MAAIDTLNASIQTLAATVATLKTTVEGLKALPAQNDAAIEAAAQQIDTINADLTTLNQ